MELPFSMDIGYDTDEPVEVARFADYAVARGSAIRRLRTLDLARSEQAMTAVVCFNGAPVFEAHADGERNVVIDLELLDPSAAHELVQVPVGGETPVSVSTDGV